MIMQNQATMKAGVRPRTGVAVTLQLAGALLLGFTILYGVGFVQTSAVHNAAHDVRHAAAFPCH